MHPVGNLGVHPAVKLQAFILGENLHRFQYVLENLAQAKGSVVKLQCSGLDLGQIDQIVDDQ